MPKGGPRVNAGRPLGSVAAKHQITAAIVGRDEYLPIEYMLALMRDEQAEPQRRDAMAIQAAPYCHARLNAVATSPLNSSGAGQGDINIVQIFAVPRGAALDVKGGTVTIEGKADVELTTLEPFEGTPAMRSKEMVRTPEPAGVVSRSEPLPVFDLDVANVTRLDTYRDKPDD